MGSMGYNGAKSIMSNGERILEGMNDFRNSPKIECKDYPVWDGDRWDDSWSHDSWQDSHGN